MVEIVEARDDTLKDVAGVSGGQPVFDASLLRSLTWAADHYVAPLSVVLAKTTPPNLPRAPSTDEPGEFSPARSTGPLIEIATASAQRRKMPTTAVVGPWQTMTWIGALPPVLSAGASVLVLVATAAEVQQIHEAASVHLGDRVLGLSGETDAEVTRVWERAQGPGVLIVGTPRVSFWQVATLALVVVLEEGRRAMKDRQTPTVHARDFLRTRSSIEGFNLVFYGPTPSVELLAAGATVVRAPGRPWSHIEVVDRSDEGPGAGLLSDQTIAAIRAIGTGSADRVFVLTGHKMAERLVEEINQRVRRSVAGVAPTDAPVVVGTERDLAGLAPVTLTVVPDVDFLLSGTGYRASEEALRQLARLGNAMGRGAGRRMIIQTRRPGTPLIDALRRGDPIPYLETVLVRRARDQVPPAVEMIAIEIRGDLPDGVDAEIAGLDSADVLGPMSIEGGLRWLISGDLGNVRQSLRVMVGRWRERGATVRIDADPIDF